MVDASSRGKEAVGARIRACANALKPPIQSPQPLCELLQAELRKGDPRQTVTRQTVSNWWHGKVYPSLDMLPALAAVLRTEEEYVLFGKRRGEQLKHERHYLSRVNELEAEALSLIREMSSSGQRSALKFLKTLAEENPAAEADVHPLRRKSDRKPG